jgi:hypothetical protein
MGDWVAHPSNTAAKRILVTYFFLAAMTGEGIPEPPGTRMNNFILCPMIIVFRMNNPTEFILCPMIIIFPMLSPSTRGKLLQTKSAGSGSFVISLQANNQFLSHQQKWSLIDDHVQEDQRLARKIDVCVCDFVYLIMMIWPHCNLVLMYQ